ncbi:MAG: PucR family transcriptional regulator [Chloroflexi bacterium]|nr:PucR family transcriptional regulator [Chloroflexota bacterium]
MITLSCRATRFSNMPLCSVYIQSHRTRVRPTCIISLLLLLAPMKCPVYHVNGGCGRRTDFAWKDIMLTIRDALELPILERATLVAGFNGQDNVIRRVHVADFPGAKFEWAKGGELLLTTGFGLLDNEAAQRALIPKLASKNLAGLILSIEHYLKHAPQAICEAGNRLDFPIIELPPDVSFVDIIEVVFSHIVSEHYAIRERVDQIHRTLTTLVLEGGTLQDLADVLSDILERSVVIENTAFEVLATAQVGAADGARIRSQTEGRAPPDIAEQLIKYGIYQKLHGMARPVYVPAIPELEMTMDRIVATIIVAHQVMGYMWIIAGERELTSLDELTLEHAATVAALIMFKERAVHQAQMTLRGDFVEQLFNVSDSQDAELAERAQQLDFNLDLSYQVLVVTETDAAPEAAPSLLAHVEQWIAPLHAALAVPRGSHVTLILQSHHLPQGNSIAAQLVDIAHADGTKLLVGIGRAVNNLAGLRRSYNQAIEALEIATALGQREGLRDFDTLGVLHWLRHLGPKVLHENTYLGAIHRLADYDTRYNHNLLLTLETYLDEGSMLTVASMLYVHRNTLSYRLERIQQLLDLDLSDPICRMNVHVALKTYRLRNTKPPSP